MRPIDADAMIVEQCGQCDGACEMFDGQKCLSCKADCRCDLREAIDNAPTLDYAPVVHGEWIECPTYDEDGYYFVDYKCSECKRFVPIKEPYCHCGAKMDGKEDA